MDASCNTSPVSHGSYALISMLPVTESLHLLRISHRQMLAVYLILSVLICLVELLKIFWRTKQHRTSYYNIIMLRSLSPHIPPTHLKRECQSILRYPLHPNRNTQTASDDNGTENIAFVMTDSLPPVEQIPPKACNIPSFPHPAP